MLVVEPEPDEKGKWRVIRDGEQVAWCNSKEEAERAASAMATPSRDGPEGPGL